MLLISSPSLARVRMVPRTTWCRPSWLFSASSSSRRRPFCWRGLVTQSIPQREWVTAEEMCVCECHSCLQGEVEQAIQMYQKLHRWEDAIAVAEARVRRTSTNNNVEVHILIYTLIHVATLVTCICSNLYTNSLLLPPPPTHRVTLTWSLCSPPTSSGWWRVGKRREQGR